MKKFFYLIAALLLSTPIVFADPAWPDSVLIHQPDGTDLWVYDRGDEYFHWEETTDGFVIVPNAQGVYEYASVQNNKLNASGVKAIRHPMLMQSWMAISMPSSKHI